MKIKTLLLLLAVCILPGSLCAGVVFSPDTLGTGKLYRDSTYRRVIKEGTANLDCYFSYPQGGWQIQRGYGGNARELERLDKFMRSSFADTLIYVRRITLTGYCSIEGSYAANEKLAHDRANGFRNYLDTEYGLARRFPVEVRYVGEDWDRLRQLVEASTLPGRAEVLAVIDNTDIFKGREKKLMDLQGGVPYNLMLAELFPLLRRVEIRVEYDLHRIIEERYRRKLTDAEFQEILARERASAEADCTQSDVMEPVPNENVEIKLISSAIAAETMTRAPYEGTIAADNTLAARVLVSETSGNYTTTYANDKMVFTDNGSTAVGFATAKYYPVDNSTLHICGLYPFEGWGNPANDECKFTFNGSQDVMAAPEKSSTKNDSKDGNYPQLEFKHLLTQLVIKAVAEDEAAIAKWGKLTDITLTKVGKNNPSGAVTVSLSAGTADESSAFATLLDNGMSFWVRGAGTETAFASQAKELTTDGEEVAYSMVAPLKNATGTADYTLAVKTEHSGTTPVTVPVNLKTTGSSSADYTASTQGKKFVVLLTFKATEIKATATVKDWEEDGGSSEEIQ